MRYVKMARHEREENVEVIQVETDIYYRTTRNIGMRVIRAKTMNE